MKQAIIVICTTIAIVFIMYIWNESEKRKVLSQAQTDWRIFQLQDSVKFYHIADSTLRQHIIVQESTLLVVRDSIKLYKNKLVTTKINYETRIANMFNWTDSEHIRFFSTQTDTIK